MKKFTDDAKAELFVNKYYNKLKPWEQAQFSQAAYGRHYKDIANDILDIQKRAIKGYIGKPKGAK